MNMLVLDRVRKSYRDGSRNVRVLDDVSLELSTGEYVAVWGLRLSGRSTLLRIAAGIEPPDEGSVMFEGRDLKRCGEALGAGVGFVQTRFASGEGRSVREQVMMGLLASGVSPARARERTLIALCRCGIHELGSAGVDRLDRAETIRLGIARALALEPKLLIVDEPTNGVELMQRDTILALLRELADEGVGVLASAADAPALTGADKTLALGDGELRGARTARLAPVVPLRRSA